MVKNTRRSFTPQFKLRVLQAYRYDSECRGNQRATARKFGIHRRQIQKWIALEENLRLIAARAVQQKSDNTLLHIRTKTIKEDLDLSNNMPMDLSIKKSDEVLDLSLNRNSRCEDAQYQPIGLARPLPMRPLPVYLNDNSQYYQYPTVPIYCSYCNCNAQNWVPQHVQLPHQTFVPFELPSAQTPIFVPSLSYSSSSMPNCSDCFKTDCFTSAESDYYYDPYLYTPAYQHESPAVAIKFGMQILYE